MEKRYDCEELQAAYEFACEWLCDEATAAKICDAVGQYGSPVALVSAEEWNAMDDDAKSSYNCLIGEDEALNWYVIDLR